MIKYDSPYLIVACYVEKFKEGLVAFLDADIVAFPVFYGIISARKTNDRLQIRM